jgi:subtilisin family serine protease
MKRIVAFLRNGLVLIAIVVVVAGVSVVLTLLRGEGGDGAAESPLATPAATVDVLEKIEPELLELVELEEQQPGQAQEEASWGFPFDEQGRVSVIIGLDPDVIVVRRRLPGTPVGQQEASQLILAYGAEIYDEIYYGNLITAHVPLDQIRALAQEEAVTDIWLDKIIEMPEDPVVPTLPPSPEGLLQDDPVDPNTHIRADLLWARGYTGEGIKVAIVDTDLDVHHSAFNYVGTSAIDISDTERDGGALGC